MLIENGGDLGLYGVIGLFITSLFAIGQRYFDSRDAKEARKERQDAEASIKLNLDARTAELAKATEEHARLVKFHAEELARQINSNVDANTDLTREIGVKADQAFREANNFNVKFAQAKNSANAELLEKVDSIEKTGEDTNTVVNQLEKK